MTGDLDTDVAVLGAGPAGGNAALGAARAGLRVALVDEQQDAGGQVWRAKGKAIRAAPETPESRAGSQLRALIAASAVDHLADTRLWQIERHGPAWRLGLLQGGEPVQLTARALVVASGAREFVQPVPGWTTPGVLGLAGATALLKRDMVVPGAATIVAGTGPLVFFTAAEIRRLGGHVQAIVTPNTRADWMRALPAMLVRPDLLARGARWMADLALSGVPIHWGHALSRVIGEDRVVGAEVHPLDSDWRPAGPVREIAADSLCLGNGLVPSIEAAQLAGCPIRHDPALGGWVPDADDEGKTPVDGLFVCGDGAGIRGAAAAAYQGSLAGQGVARFLGAQVPGIGPRHLRRYRRAAAFGRAMTALSAPRPGLSSLIDDATVLCRCEGVTSGALRQAIAAGATSANATKSGLRCGMGPCGGAYCQTAVTRQIAVSTGRSEGEVPPPTARPPLRPVPLGGLAGDIAYEDLPIPKPAPL
ncbi:FAD-dependent oxidoreductase [Oceanibium sediminis]|uniref:FAD-dependent oxidoreductase n=1 Tax=Oceanibium sediminis TaxID=2026339 RepID=UPI000DD2B917|nr:FAD-dependent oxidoreductase [Oceanibium sediminis]